MLSFDNASAWELGGRSLIRTGYVADLVVFCLHLLQLQFQLIQQVAAPFRGLAVPLSTQLRDQQLQMFDLGFRPCPDGTLLGQRRPFLGQRRPFLGQRSAQGGDLCGGVGGGGHHGRE